MELALTPSYAVAQIEINSSNKPQKPWTIRYIVKNQITFFYRVVWVNFGSLTFLFVQASSPKQKKRGVC